MRAVIYIYKFIGIHNNWQSTERCIYQRILPTSNALKNLIKTSCYICISQVTSIFIAHRQRVDIRVFFSRRSLIGALRGASGNRIYYFLIAGSKRARGDHRSAGSLVPILPFDFYLSLVSTLRKDFQSDDRRTEDYWSIFPRKNSTFPIYSTCICAPSCPPFFDGFENFERKREIYVYIERKKGWERSLDVVLLELSARGVEASIR